MESLLIFGSGAASIRIRHEAERSGKFRVVGFVDNAPAIVAMDVPVVTADEAIARFDRAHTLAFASGDACFLNQDRLSTYMRVKGLGFRVASIVSGTAVVARDVKLRENVFIDANVRVLPGANIGANTWVLHGSEVGVNAKLGTSCWVSSSCDIGDGASLGKNCTLGSGVVIDSGVVLPAWSLINQTMRISESLTVPLFIDPLFRGPVVLRGKSFSAKVDSR
jgi:serine acetyltransferase